MKILKGVKGMKETLQFFSHDVGDLTAEIALIVNSSFVQGGMGRVRFLHYRFTS
jgi:hypothetical protein